MTDMALLKGIMAVPTRELTKQGFESQFACCHLAHFLLFQLLKDTLLTSSTPDLPSRIVNVASVGHRYGPGVQFDNLNFDKDYSGWAAYSQAKTANIYMANYIERCA
jgi:NAD(P)-dependent dehydrogenase (short-subunit alcohol dehydrogenase family)